MTSQYNEILVSQMGAPLSVDENAALYPRVLAGDPDAREQMITGNMALVLGKVESFIRAFPHAAYLRDDLASAGFIRLTKIVNSYAKGKKVNEPTYYLARGICNDFSGVLEKEMTIRVPETTRRRLAEEGNEDVMPTVLNTIPERWANAPYESELEFRDLLDSCCHNEEERTFLRMREEGYTLTEIAQAIHRPVSSTCVMGKQLEARIDRTIERTR